MESKKEITLSIEKIKLIDSLSRKYKKIKLQIETTYDEYDNPQIKLSITGNKYEMEQFIIACELF